jgi:SAM-dependent methyltransferase
VVEQKWDMGSEDYLKALDQEGEYWGQEVDKALKKGIPFTVDMRRAEHIYVHRGPGLPQQQYYDPETERLMNGDLYQYVFDQINKISEQANVLVLTCGAGGLSLEIARQGHHVLGVDISQRAIEIAKAFAERDPSKKSSASLDYKVVDLNRVELPPSTYDVVLAWDGLHHIIRLEHLMAQIHHTLKPGGRFIFSDNIGMHWKSRLLGGLIYLLLPTTVGYMDKFRFAIGGTKKIREDMTKRSPFEEISTEKIKNIAATFFEFVENKQHTGIGYRAAIAGDLKIKILKYSFIKLLKRFDDWAVRKGVLKGDHLLVIGKPK